MPRKPRIATTEDVDEDTSAPLQPPQRGNSSTFEARPGAGIAVGIPLDEFSNNRMGTMSARSGLARQASAGLHSSIASGGSTGRAEQTTTAPGAVAATFNHDPQTANGKTQPKEAPLVPTTSSSIIPIVSEVARVPLDTSPTPSTTEPTTTTEPPLPTHNHGGLMIQAQLAPSEDEVAQRVASRIQQSMAAEMEERINQQVAERLQQQQRQISDSAGNNNKVFRNALWWIGLLIVIVVGIVIGILMAKKGENNDTRTPVPTTGLPTKTPTNSPSATMEVSLTVSPSATPPTEMTRFEQFVQFIGANVSDQADIVFADGSTFEYQTMNWLANTDTWRFAEELNFTTTTTRITNIWMERYALVYLRLSTQGWRREYNFLRPTTHCNWNVDQVDPLGVTCHDGTVVALDLYSNNIQGTIPTQLALLTNLQSLQMEDNPDIVGSIPEELLSANLSHLQWLALKQTGTLPTELGLLTQLTFFDLSFNDLWGSIPTEIGGMDELEGLYLEHNALTGPIPSEMGYLTNLQVLYLHTNQLTGRIPSELGRLANSVSLYLFENQLEGTVPMELSNLFRLNHISIEVNNLQGDLNIVFCNRLLPYIDFWADCGGFSPKVVCSCCTVCCDRDGQCRDQ